MPPPLPLKMQCLLLILCCCSLIWLYWQGCIKVFLLLLVRLNLHKKLEKWSNNFLASQNLVVSWNYMNHFFYAIKLTRLCMSYLANSKTWFGNCLSISLTPLIWALLSTVVKSSLLSPTLADFIHLLLLQLVVGSYLTIEYLRSCHFLICTVG